MEAIASSLSETTLSVQSLIWFQSPPMSLSQAKLVMQTCPGKDLNIEQITAAMQV
jgi:hypothetical protein